jgi:GntR family transcriptional regulator
LLDRNSPKPLYAQLEEILREAIYNQEWAPNHAIPSEIELSKMYDISRMTTRSVLTQLVNEGLLYRVQGKGTFVSDSKIKTPSPAYLGVRELLAFPKHQTATKLISFSEIKADRQAAAMLKVNVGDPLYYVQRVRSAKGENFSLHFNYIPQSLVQGLTGDGLEDEALNAILQRKYGLRSIFISETVELAIAGELESKLLDINAGHPLLMLEDLHKTANGRIFEYAKVLLRVDKVKLRFEYVAQSESKYDAFVARSVRQSDSAAPYPNMGEEKTVKLPGPT